MSVEPFEKPICTVDAILFRMHQDVLCVGLIKRAHDARVYPSVWSLPGGFVYANQDQTIEDTLYRTLANKVGIIPARILKMDFEGGVARDPDGWSITCPFLCLVGHQTVNSSQIRWEPIDGLIAQKPSIQLPFDHLKLIRSAFEKLHQRAKYSTEPNALLTNPFTLPQLQKVYEAILSVGLHKKNFRDRIIESGSVIEMPVKVVVGKTKASLYQHNQGVCYFNRVMHGAKDDGAKDHG